MPDQETQAIYDELNRRGVFKNDQEAQQIGHELRRRGVVADPTQGGLVSPQQPKAPVSPASGNAAVDFAMKSRGTSQYKWGGASPEAMDCSGLTCQAYSQLGLKLPRTAREQFGVGKPVQLKDLQPGDQVFFEGTQANLGPGEASHTGIYVGDGKFIHQTKGGTKISTLNGYGPKYLGAKQRGAATMPERMGNLATLNQDIMNQAFSPPRNREERRRALQVNIERDAREMGVTIHPQGKVKKGQPSQTFSTPEPVKESPPIRLLPDSDLPGNLLQRLFPTPAATNEAAMKKSVRGEKSYDFNKGVVQRWMEQTETGRGYALLAEDKNAGFAHYGTKLGSSLAGMFDVTDPVAGAQLGSFMALAKAGQLGKLAAEMVGAGFATHQVSTAVDLFSKGDIPGGLAELTMAVGMGVPSAFHAKKTIGEIRGARGGKKPLANQAPPNLKAQSPLDLRDYDALAQAAAKRQAPPETPAKQPESGPGARTGVRPQPTEPSGKAAAVLPEVETKPVENVFAPDETVMQSAVDMVNSRSTSIDQFAKQHGLHPGEAYRYLTEAARKVEAEELKAEAAANVSPMPISEPQAKQHLTSEPQRSAQITPAAEPPREKYSQLGTNVDGNPLFEDANGVRSYVVDGVRQTESVRMVPTRQGVQPEIDVAGRTNDFRTVDEVGVKESPKPAEPTHPTGPGEKYFIRTFKGGKATWQEVDGHPVTEKLLGDRDVMVHTVDAEANGKPVKEFVVSDARTGHRIGSSLEGVQEAIKDAREKVERLGADKAIKNAEKVEGEHLSPRYAKAEPTAKPNVVKEEKPTTPKGDTGIGAESSHMGMKTRLMDVQEIDGVIYELHGQIDGKEGGIRVFDKDSGEVLTHTRGPYFTINLRYNETVAKARKMGGAPKENPDVSSNQPTTEKNPPGAVRSDQRGEPQGSEPAAAPRPETARPTDEGPRAEGATGDKGDAGTPEQRPDLGRGVREGERGDTPVAGQPGTAGGEAAENPKPAKKPAKDTKSERTVKGSDFRITPEVESTFANTTQGDKLKNLNAAIKTLKDLERTGRPITEADKAALVKFPGWGWTGNMLNPKNVREHSYRTLTEHLTAEERVAAEGATQNSHYTSPEVIRGMYKALERLGFTGGKVIEPSAGIGHILGLMPDEMRGSSTWRAIEKDSLTARILSKLYEQAKVDHSPYEKLLIPDDSFDLAVSNVPFGNIAITDPRFLASGADPLIRNRIHNYFFAKALQQVRPGGIVAFITSEGTLNARDSVATATRAYLNEHANFLGAIRLPNDAFMRNAGTEVTTDIIFLQKSGPGVKKRGGNFKEIVEVPLLNRAGETVPGYINEYFVNNPKMVLGEHTMQGKMRGAGDQYALKPKQGVDLAKALEEAISNLPENVYTRLSRESQIKIDAAKAERITRRGRVGSLTVKDGKVFVQEDAGQAKALEDIDPKTIPVLESFSTLRDSYSQVVNAMKQGWPEEQIKALQADMKKNYDAYVKKFGVLNSRQRDAWIADPESYGVLALEKFDKVTKKVTGLADIFDKIVIRPIAEPTSVGSPKEALVASLRKTGAVDAKVMGDLTGQSPEAILKQLESEGLVYRDPANGAYVTADEYGSGNVRKKLEIAKLAGNEAHVKFLEAVQPRDLKPGEIRPKMGATWIPADVYKQFVAHLLNKKPGDITLQYNKLASKWHMSTWKDYSSEVSRTKTWGTDRVDAIDLLDDALNGRIPMVYDKVDGKQVQNKAATEVAQAKLEAIKEEWEAWVYKDIDRATNMAEIYNRDVNVRTDRKFDGSHLDFPGQNPTAFPNGMRPQQKNAVWRTLQQKNVLLAHEVGVGKTATIISSAMEMRRTGLRNKPMIAVKKSGLQQMGKDFKKLYPGAKILLADEEAIAGKRREFMGKVQTGDWDAVILTHDALKRLQVNPATEARYIEKQIAEAREYLYQQREEGNNYTVKEVEKMVDNLEAKLEQRMDDVANIQDDALYWDDLGVDQLYVDEAHKYKNLEYQSQFPGVGMTGSDIAFDLYLKSAELQANGGGMVWATGTPLTNSVAEMHSILRYLAKDILAEMNMEKFDDWARTFVTNEISLEPNVAGIYKPKSRFTKFANVPELMQMYRSVADIVFAEDVGEIERPRLVDREGNFTDKPILVETRATPVQLAYFKNMVKRAKEMKYPPEKGGDTMLSISTDGRHVSLDPRTRISGAADDPNSKVNSVIRETYREYADKQNMKDKRTQLIFMDLGVPSKEEGRFNLYADIKQKLVKLGVKAEEIAFIQDHTTDAKKEAIQQAIRDGKVRIVLGSREMMGVGLNVQDRLIAVHQVDPVWRPDLIEQSNGRIIRQGMIPEFRDKGVRVYMYAGKGTFDEFMWANVERKSKFIKQVLNGTTEEREIEDLSGNEAFTFAELQAMSTGNPAISDLIKTSNNVKKLETLRKSYQNALHDTNREVKMLKNVYIPDTERQVAMVDRVIQLRNKNASGGKEWAAKVEGKKFAGKDDVENFKAALDSYLDGVDDFHAHKIGEFEGFSLSVNRAMQNYAQGKSEVIHQAVLTDPTGSTWTSGPREITEGIVTKLKNVLAGLEEERQRNLDKIAGYEKQIPKLEAEAAKPFPKEADLKAQQELRRKLEAEVGVSVEGAQQGWGAGMEAQPPGAVQSFSEKQWLDVIDEAEGRGPARGSGGGSTAYSKGGLADDARTASKAAGTATGAVERAMQGGASKTYVQPVPTPEMVRIARLLTGKAPAVAKLRAAIGRFQGKGRGNIAINPNIGSDPMQVAATLAHEIGHLIDYLPDETLKRGNLLGRVATMRKFLKHTLKELPDTTVKEIRGELLEVSKWWRGDFAATDKYRTAGKELYADAISVWMNAPDELAIRAPKFNDALNLLLDRKPEVLEAYAGIQKLLNAGPDAIQEARSGEIRQGFRAGEEARRKAALYEPEKQTLKEHIAQTLFDAYAPALKRETALVKSGQIAPGREVVKYALDELAYKDNTNHALLTAVEKDVVRPITEADIHMDDVGEFMFYRRTMNERGDLINPFGHTAETAKAGMDALRKKLGDTKFQQMESDLAKFDDMVFDAAERAVNAGVYNRDTFDNVIEPNKGNYAAYAVVEYITSDNVDAAIRGQVGTFKEVENPFITTVMKTMALNRAIEINVAKRTVIGQMKRFYPEEIKRQPVEPGHRPKAAEAGHDYIVALENGHPAYYEVDQYTAKMFKRPDVAEIMRPLKALRDITHTVFHPLFVTFNPSFQLANIPRDLLRTWINLGSSKDISLGSLVKSYIQALPEARKRALHKESPLIDEMIKNKALDIPFSELAVTDESNSYSRSLERYGVVDGEGKPKPIVIKQLAAGFEKLKQIGDTIEAASKVGAYTELRRRNIPEREAAYLTRNYAGTPNWRRRGTATDITNSLFMYSNVALQGWRADAEIALAPKSRAGWWLRSMLVGPGPKLAMKAAALGAFGTGVAAMMNRISDYDKANYTIIPIGEDEGKDGKKRTVYLRLPVPDTQRMLGGIEWYSLAGDPQGVLKYVLGHIPNEAPPIKLGKTWMSYAEGQNPRDTFRDKDILTRDQQILRGGPAFLKMLDWTADQMGVAGQVKRLAFPREGEEKTGLQHLLDTPGIERFIKISNSGEIQQEREKIRQHDVELAEKRAKRTDAEKQEARDEYWKGRLNAAEGGGRQAKPRRTNRTPGRR